MYRVESDTRQAPDLNFRMDPEEDAAHRSLLSKGGSSDTVTVSDEAENRMRRSGLEPLWGDGYSLKSMQRRIYTVRQEIDAIWSSDLPDDEKMRQIGSRKNEIALLQAGQFGFARSMVSRSV